MTQNIIIPEANFGYPADWIVDRVGMGVLAGGEPQAPIQLPIDGPSVNGPDITIDMMLAQPTRVNRAIRDMSLQKWIADLIFAGAGGVAGGAVVYDQATTNEMYATRDAQQIVPGAAFPLVTSERLVPKIARVQKWGGKFFFTDEARERNAQGLFAQHTQRLTNTIIRKNNQRAMEVVDASITESAQSFVGNNWSAYQPAGTSPTAPANTPWADINKGQMLADQMELGIVYDTLLLNPVQATALKNARVKAEDLGITTVFVSNRVPQGSAYLLARGQVGEMRVEKPLQTVSWYDEEHEQTWVQASVRNVMYVTNPYSIVKITNLAG